jgi:hypothetical protein
MSTPLRRTTLGALAAAALVGTSVLSAPAHAATEEQVVGGLITPLSLAVAPDGTVYVANNFAGLLTKAAPGQEAEYIYADEGGREVGAVSVVHEGAGDVVTFATTNQDGSAGAMLYTLDGEGNQTEVADLWAFEQETNPDGGQKYGIVGLTRACKKEFRRKQRWMLPYKGIAESHPYASTTLGDTTYVADAAANAILAVDADGVSTQAVLPATKIEVTRKVRRALDLPACTKGKTFKVEPVPTDVEAGPDGNLYVTSLPGGPEDPAMGANGAVYQVNLTTGAVTRIAGGLVTPTGLAIGPDGTAYVSMLFAGVIMKQPLGGEPSVFAEVDLPGDVEISGGHVYATRTGLMDDQDAPPNGQVLRWPAG